MAEKLEASIKADAEAYNQQQKGQSQITIDSGLCHMPDSAHHARDSCGCLHMRPSADRATVTVCICRVCRVESECGRAAKIRAAAA